MAFLFGITRYRDEIQYKDSSAGAITAAGLLLISQCIQDPEEAKQYRDWGNFLLQGLMNSCDLTGDESALGLLANGALPNKLVCATTCCRTVITTT
ncbi:hypothetical protein P4S64_15110 [Vibrio sp. M60_M31a]